jgi:hypothetical protein
MTIAVCRQALFCRMGNKNGPAIACDAWFDSCFQPQENAKITNTFSDALRLFQNHPHITLRQSSEALAKPFSSVLQAQVSEASIQNWNALTESILRLKVWK